MLLQNTTLLPEEQLALLHAEALPCQARLRRWQALPWLGVLGVGLLTLGQSLFALSALALTALGAGVTARDRRRLAQVRQRVVRLAPELKSPADVCFLLDFVRWFGPQAEMESSVEVLSRLLPRLSLTEAQTLTEEQRAYLRHCAENQEPTVELAIAALLVLVSLQDTATLPILRALAATSSSQRLREAAQLCLEELPPALAVRA